MSIFMTALAVAAAGHGLVLAAAYRDRPEARRMLGLGLASGAMLLATAGVLWFGLGR